MPDAPKEIQIPSGLVCVTTYGVITHQTVDALMQLRAHSDKAGITNVQYLQMPGTLVEKARNEAVRHMLRANAGWLCFIDADMVFPPDALQRLLLLAYGEQPWWDAVGAYCPLRGELAIRHND